MVQMMNDKTQGAIIAKVIARNVGSIRAIPKTHITEKDRAHYLEIAKSSSNVYAYSSVNAWYIWCKNIRIPLAPLADIEWEFVSYSLIEDCQQSRVMVVFEKQQPDMNSEIGATRIRITIYPTPHQHIPWQIVALTNDIAKWHKHPAEYDGIHLTF